MRVLQVHCGYRVPAGEDAVVDAEAELLEARGHDVAQHLVHNPTSPPVAGVTLLASPKNPLAARQVAEHIASFRPDVAHVHNTWFALGSSILPELHRAGVPTVMTIHNYRTSCISGDLFRDDAVCTACVGTNPWRGVLHRCYRGTYGLSLVAAVESRYHARRSTLDRNVTSFVAPSHFIRDRLVEMGFDPERLVVKPHFVMDNGERTVAAEDADRVLCVGRLAPGKGIASLLRAERIREPKLKLTIVGDGPLAPELRESAPRGVEFLGWRDRDTVLQLMRSSRALVLPSEWFEPFGMVLLEAMAAGLPIVVNRVADAVSITGANGRLVSTPSDDDSLAECLRSLADDQLVACEGRRMRDRYLERYTPEVNGPLLERIYDNTIAGVRAT